MSEVANGARLFRVREFDRMAAGGKLRANVAPMFPAPMIPI
jgi:hypothetical protein